MPINILMPALSPTMTEGNLARWLKKEGDPVKSGDVIAEIETDKATMEVEAVDEGKIGKILVPAGAQGVKVNDVIAVLLEEGESPGDIKAGDIKAPAAAPAPKPAAAPAPKTDGVQAKAEPPKQPAASLAPTPGAASGTRIFASPLAKRLAQQHGLDLSRIVGSGPHGRVVKIDIEKAAASGGAKAAPAPAAAKGLPSAPSVPGTPAFGEPEFDLTPHSMMRKTIARRLQESKQFVPHFYLTIDCEIDRLLKMREEINGGAPKEGKGAFKLSVNDLIIKACAIALKQVPAANASWSDDGVKMYKTADI
ncbi:MAG TPA: 2-oxo acid dehydrogenase subunit E2, partial [Dongiaceae bacterium]